MLGIDLDDHYLAQAQFARDAMGLQDLISLENRQIYSLATEAEAGRKFDVILFMGVFYHLRYPLLGLDVVASLLSDDGIMVFQTLEAPGAKPMPPAATKNLNFQDRTKLAEPGWPRLHFFEHGFNDDPTNWWAADPACVEALLRSSGLDIVAEPGDEIYVCRRSATPPPGVPHLRRNEYRAALSGLGHPIVRRRDVSPRCSIVTVTASAGSRSATRSGHSTTTTSPASMPSSSSPNPMPSKSSSPERGTRPDGAPSCRPGLGKPGAGRRSATRRRPRRRPGRSPGPARRSSCQPRGHRPAGPHRRPRASARTRPATACVAETLSESTGDGSFMGKPPSSSSSTAPSRTSLTPASVTTVPMAIATDAFGRLVGGEEQLVVLAVVQGVPQRVPAVRRQACDVVMHRHSIASRSAPKRPRSLGRSPARPSDRSIIAVRPMPSA